MTKKNETHWLLWKRVLLEMAELENGRLEKGALGKWCSWVRVLLEMGAFGNG